MTPIPLLILGDGPDLKTGLGRIGHDLAWLLSSMPEFRVGYMGRLSFGRAKFPWAQYSFSEREQWGENRLEEAWEDLSQGHHGIVFTIWDASRLLWLADPREMPERLQRLIDARKFERWGYFMADGAGSNPSRLPAEQEHVLRQYDRVLMASRWAYELARPAELKDCDWMPHGINTDAFRPVDRELARSIWGVGKDDIVIGCVMANQARKHWPVVMEAVARIPHAYLWMHTDTLSTGYWNLAALAVEYGVADRCFIDDRRLTDREMAMRYSGCDATMVISGGEGFCYPVAESLACGCPVVVGEYGAACELVGRGVRPAHTMLETNHNVRRAFYYATDIVKALSEAVGWNREQVTERVEHLSWTKLSVQWKKWIRRGLRNGLQQQQSR